MGKSRDAFARFPQTALGRGERPSGHDGELVERSRLEQAKRQDQSFIGGQLAQKSEGTDQELSAVQIRDVLEQTRVLERAPEHPAAQPSFANLVSNRVDSNASGPSIQAFRIAKLADVPKDLDENLVNQVVVLVVRAEQRPDQTIDCRREPRVNVLLHAGSCGTRQSHELRGRKAKERRGPRGLTRTRALRRPAQERVARCGLFGYQ